MLLDVQSSADQIHDDGLVLVPITVSGARGAPNPTTGGMCHRPRTPSPKPTWSLKVHPATRYQSF